MQPGTQGNARNARQAHPFLGSWNANPAALGGGLRHPDRHPHPVPPSWSGTIHNDQSTTPIPQLILLSTASHINVLPQCLCLSHLGAPSGLHPVRTVPSLWWMAFPTTTTSANYVQHVLQVALGEGCMHSNNKPWASISSVLHYFTSRIMCLRHAPIALVRLQRLFCL